MRTSTTKVLAVLTVILAFAAACGNQSKSENTSTTMANGGSSSLYAMLPDKIKEAGSITIGTDATYSPDEFVGEDGAARRYMLDVVTVPLDSSGAMSATARETEVT